MEAMPLTPQIEWSSDKLRRHCWRYGGWYLPAPPRPPSPSPPMPQTTNSREIANYLLTQEYKQNNYFLSKVYDFSSGIYSKNNINCVPFWNSVCGGRYRGAGRCREGEWGGGGGGFERRLWNWSPILHNHWRMETPPPPRRTTPHGSAHYAPTNNLIERGLVFHLPRIMSWENLVHSSPSLLLQ